MKARLRSVEVEGLASASICPKPQKYLVPLEEINPYWVWFTELKGVTVPEKLLLLRLMRSPDEIWALTRERSGSSDPKRLKALFGDLRFKDLRAKLIAQKSMASAMDVMKKSNKLGIRMMVLDLKALDRAVAPDSKMLEIVLAVYVMGEVVGGPSAAVVGTREATGDGYRGAEVVCRSLLAEGVCVNSGMALGIDCFAQKLVLADGGHSQGFAAHGLDLCYPSEHYSLMRQLAEEGAVISPFPVGTQPYPGNFLKRNALMSAWSDEVVVVEAGMKSGAMDTAGHALRQGRLLWVVPGREDSERCAGNQWLLGTGQGQAFEVRQSSAGRVVSGELENEISQMEKLKQTKLETKGDEAALGQLHKTILEILRASPERTEVLQDLTGAGTAELEAALLVLEARRWVQFLQDGRWRYSGW